MMITLEKPMSEEFENENENEMDAESSPFSDDQPEEQTEEELLASIESAEEDVSVAGSELDAFESAQIEEEEFIEDEQAESIIESLLFASDKSVSLSTLRELFKGTNITRDHIKRIIERLSVEYASAKRGVVLEEVTGGYQLRTKVDNMKFLRRLLKGRSFKLSGPALEVLSIVAYKQPVIKSEIDDIRGVESGHLLRALMEKGLVNFEGKSELPGRPMQYATTRKFLEIFGLRNLKELPTLSQIDELLPEGIGAEETKKETLSDVTDSLAQAITGTYSEGEEELEKIQADLQTVDTTTSFFEEEKKRIKEEEKRQKAQDIREAVAVGEQVDPKDLKWLAKYEAEQAVSAAPQEAQGSEESDTLRSES
jgi:segregation and condensation protein B